MKPTFLSQQEMDIMVSRNTLNLQVGMSLNARAQHFAKRFKKKISAYQLRKLYYGRGVTLQSPQVRLGPKNLGTPEEQM